jgi:hypothetical protein
VRRVPGLLDATCSRGIAPTTAILDRSYDQTVVYGARGARPIIPLRQTIEVKQGKGKPPSREQGECTFAGADVKRQVTKWPCPTGECQPASTWLKTGRMRTLVPALPSGGRQPTASAVP